MPVVMIFAKGHRVIAASGLHPLGIAVQEAQQSNPFKIMEAYCLAGVAQLRASAWLTKACMDVCGAAASSLQLQDHAC